MATEDQRQLVAAFLHGMAATNTTQRDAFDAVAAELAPEPDDPRWEVVRAVLREYTNAHYADEAADAILAALDAHNANADDGREPADLYEDRDGDEWLLCADGHYELGTNSSFRLTLDTLRRDYGPLSRFD